MTPDTRHGCKWADWIIDILPYVSSPHERFIRPPDDLIILELRRAARNFAEQSRFFRDTLPVDLQCGVCELPFITPDDRTVLEVIRVERPESCDRHCRTQSNKLDFSYHNDDMIWLDSPPNADHLNGAVIHYSYLPTFHDCDVPAKLCAERWRTAIQAQALNNLLSMPNMDWYDLTNAQIQQAKSAKLIAQARLATTPKRKKPSVTKAMEGVFWDI